MGAGTPDEKPVLASFSLQLRAIWAAAEWDWAWAGEEAVEDLAAAAAARAVVEAVRRREDQEGREDREDREDRDQVGCEHGTKIRATANQ